MKNSKGFTLIELMIVIAIIAIIASIAIPNLLSARLSANESSAIATLRNVVSAQSQVQSQGAIDVDVDGIGEHGWFAEMAGTVVMRDALGTGPLLNPPVLSASLGNINATGQVNKSGYLYGIYLPDAAGPGAPLSEVPTVGGSPGGESSDLCETTWIAYGWPATFSNTGNRAFCVNQTGDVLQTNNLAGPGANGHYSSTVAADVPTGDAAIESGFPGLITGGLSIAGRPAAANDGNVWVVVN